jgi:hypothetical protein
MADLCYFAPHLGWRRGSILLAAKGQKALRLRRLRARLREGSSDRDLLVRLRLPEDAPQRHRLLEETWRPLVPLLAPAAPQDPGAAPLRARALAVLDGRQILFGHELEVGWPPRWGWRWDDTPGAAVFAADVRSTWEIQRLQGILPLAWAVHLAEEEEREEFGEAYLRALLDFQRTHPGPDDPAWESALELGLRLIALGQGLPLVVSTRAWAANDLVVLHLLDRHARWLAAGLSLDKVVRGNHLLGELAGLLVIGHLLPSAREAWWGGQDVQGLLEQEVLRQFHADGVSVEQSLPYEKFILEFLLVAGLLSRYRETPFSPEVRERLCRAAGHLEAVTTPDGTLPRIGDCDSGRGALVPPEADPHRPCDLGERLRAEFGEDEERPPAAGASGEGGSPVLRLFPEGGHAVVRPSAGDYLFLRGGPFGWGIPGPASHSHADWLSPVLFLGGEAVLVDSGVYGYRLGGALRNGFRGWEAHNGVCFEPPPGPYPDGVFRWKNLGIDAVLDGRRLEAGVEVHGRVRWGRGPKALLWYRSVLYNELDASWLLLDRVSGTWMGPLSWAFHFAPGIRVEPSREEGIARLLLPSGTVLRLEFEPAAETRWEQGWVAPAYGMVQEGTILRRRFHRNPEEVRLRIERLPREAGRDS